MNEKFLIQTDDLLLAGIFWDSSDTRIFPALLSSLACSTLKVAAFLLHPALTPMKPAFLCLIHRWICCCVFAADSAGKLDRQFRFG